MKKLILTALLLGGLFAIKTHAQGIPVWNNKQCAVVLTYDDAIDARFG